MISNDDNYNNNLNRNLKKIGSKLSDFEEVQNPKKNKNYTILGKGFFGYAEKMKSKKNNIYYAIKKLDKSRIEPKYFKRETEIMINLEHQNIVKFYGFFEDKEKIEKFKDIYHIKEPGYNEREDKVIYCLILEYMPNGSLQDYAEKYKSKYNYKNYIPIDEKTIIHIFKQILNALKYLHNEKSIMHRDIKPDNILFDQNWNIKLSDFGLSAIYKNENPDNKNKPKYLFSENTTVGRVDFIAPEVERKQKYDFESDIYSLGLTMLYLMSYENPIQFYNNPEARQIIKVINSNTINKQYNKYLRNLVLLLINEDQNLRKSAKDAYDDLINIENLINSQKKQNEISYEHNPSIKNYQSDEISYKTNQSHNKLLSAQFHFNNNNSIKSNNHKFLTNKNIPIYNLNTINDNFNKQSNKGLTINNEINQNENINLKNTSLIRVIQILTLTIKEKIKSQITTKINDCFFSKLMKIMNVAELKAQNKIDKDTFIKYIKDFKYNLSLKYDSYKNDEEISPKLIISDIFKIINDDFKINNIQWDNSIFSRLIEPAYLPKDYFPHIYQRISKFTKEYINPLVDYFYFISLDLIKCHNCKFILQGYPHIRYFIHLPSERKDTVSNLIKDFIYTSKKIDMKCKTCSNEGVTRNVFFSSPKYLIIQFNGKIKEGKILEAKIDLNNYIFSNIGPKIYILHSFIVKENNEYKAIIRNKNKKTWELYSGVDIIEPLKYDPNKYYIPNMAIYEGIN